MVERTGHSALMIGVEATPTLAGSKVVSCDQDSRPGVEAYQESGKMSKGHLF